MRVYFGGTMRKIIVTAAAVLAVGVWAAVTDACGAAAGAFTAIC